MRIILFLFALLSVWCEVAQAQWTMELGTGFAYSVPIRLRIEQAWQPTIKLEARYETREFTWPWYYQMRFANWHGNYAWEVEHIHHKIFLKNKPSTIQSFSISHGYNQITINRAWRTPEFYLASWVRSDVSTP